MTRQKTPQIPKAFVKEIHKLWEMASADADVSRQLGSCEEFLKSLDQPAENGFIVQNLRDIPDSLRADLASLITSGESIPWAEGYALSSTEYQHWRKSELYRRGYFYFQDPAAMLPATLLGSKPGERVIDVCASPGGKSIAIANQLQNRGLLLANEYEYKRLPALLVNLEQVGASNIVVANNEIAELVRVGEQSFDRVMLDVPCSGSAMFRKNKRARINWKQLNHRQLHELQYELLSEGAKLLKVDGTLVYSTCSFSIAENEAQIARFLHEHPDFDLLEDKNLKRVVADGIPLADCPEVKRCYRLFPHLHAGEGHFAAVLTRTRRDLEYVADTACDKSFSEFQTIAHYRIGHQLFAMNGDESEHAFIDCLIKELKIRRIGILVGFSEEKELVDSYRVQSISPQEFKQLLTDYADSYLQTDVLKLQKINR